MHSHLARDIAENDMAVFQLYPERCIGEVFQNLTLHFNSVFLRHAVPLARCNCTALEIGFLQQAFILMGHQVCLHLGHEIHSDHYNNK